MSPASHSSMSEDTKGLRDVPVPSTSSISDAPKVTEVKDLELGLDRPSLKRKEVESSGNRFKIVSQLVIAMKRFQGERLICIGAVRFGCESIVAFDAMFRPSIPSIACSHQSLSSILRVCKSTRASNTDVPLPVCSFLESHVHLRQAPNSQQQQLRCSLEQELQAKRHTHRCFREFLHPCL